MPGRLQGRVAVITGSGGGQGAAAARLFAAEGARIVVNDVNADAAEAVAQEIRDTGGQAISVPCDISDGSAVEAMIDTTLREFGALHVLYNNAGTEAGDGSVTELDEASWDRILDVNAKSIFFTSKFGIPALRQSGGGSIINTSSVGGLVGTQGLDSYSASKGAVIALTRALAATFAAEGIRVNCICPGLVVTPMVERLGGDFISRAVSNTPMRRGARPEEIASVALFLASEESSFITGAAIPVDGGRTAI